VALGDVRPGRYLQWRATLSGQGVIGQGPALVSVDVSYLQENRRPLIKSLSVLDAGEVLVPANFNPANQAYEMAHPNRDGIFTRLGSAGDDEQRTKSLWKVGYRTLQWQAEDPNGDALEYALHFRLDSGPGAAAEAAEDDEAEWLLLAEELDDNYSSFDATVLPDGIYRFRLTVSDAPGNVAGRHLTAEKISAPVVVDHSPPQLGGASRREGTARVEVSDVWSPLREAAVSVDAGGWVVVSSQDGLVDSTREQLVFPVPDDASLVLLRLIDAAHNVRTFDLTATLASSEGQVP
jgi:hypothetical protein